MADKVKVRSGRRGKNTQSREEDELEECVVEEATAETVAESRPDEVRPEFEDEDGMSGFLDALQESLERDGSGEESSRNDQPAEETDEEAVAYQQEQQKSEGKDIKEESSSHFQDNNSRGIKEVEKTFCINEEDLRGNVDKAELEKLFDPKWAELIKQLPEFCDPGLVLEENDHKEGNTKMLYQVPMMPIAECVQQKWDDVNKELLASSQISPFRKLDDKRYWISDTDFKKFCQSSTVDREYCIQVEKDIMRGETGFGGPSMGPRRRPYVKKSNAIQNPLLQACENGFKKCDESARMAIRASSHAAFMLNALRNILEKSPSEQQADALRMIDGIQGSIESVADASSRVVARATVSRRNICMSQIQRHDQSESFEDFLTLPMDGKNLFHGEFYLTMQEHRKSNASAMKRKLPPTSVDLDQNAKRPSLMDAPYSPHGPRFNQRGRFGSPPDRFMPWGGPFDEGYNTYNLGRGSGRGAGRGAGHSTGRGSGRGTHMQRGNKRW